MTKFTKELKEATDKYITSNQRKKDPEYTALVEELLRGNHRALTQEGATIWRVLPDLEATLKELQTPAGKAKFFARAGETPEEFEKKRSELLAEAKALIGKTLVERVGSLTDQLNANTTTQLINTDAMDENKDLSDEWTVKGLLLNKIKFKHGRRLKDHIRSLKFGQDAEFKKIEESLLKEPEDWGL